MRSKKRKNKLILNQDKFISFLKHSIIDKNERKRFFFVYSNKVADTKDYRKDWRFLVSQIESRRNMITLFVIISGYLILLLAVYNSFIYFLNNCANEYRDNLYYSFLDINLFYHFFDKFFDTYFEYNDYITDISNIYYLEHNNNDYIIDNFNLNIFNSLDIYFFILNFEEIQYEHDKCLTPKKDWEKIPKKDLNIFDLEFSNYNGSFFEAFCIFEFYLEYNNYAFYDFNSNFFDLYYIYYKDEYLPNKLIDLNKFSLELPYMFFMLRTFYSIHLRHIRYNYYVRNNMGLNEYTSVKYLFILVNNPGGKNKYKIPYYKYQRLFTMQQFDRYMVPKNINNAFSLYESRFYKRSKILEFNDYIDHSVFNILLNNYSINFIKKFKDFKTWNLVYDFFNENLLGFMYNKSITKGFKLIMNFRSVYRFRLVNSTYNDLEEFVWAIYSLPISTLNFYKNLNEQTLYNLYIDLYEENFSKFYFFKDFILFNNIDYLFYFIQLISFYNKLFYLVVFFFDPLFFFLYYSQCFHKIVKRYLKTLYFTSIYMVFYYFEDSDKKSDNLIEYFNMVTFYLKWRLNLTSISYANSEFYLYGNNIASFVNSNRIRNFVMRAKFYMRDNNIRFIYDDYKYLLYVLDFYFQFIYENIEVSLIFYFLNIDRYNNLYKKNIYNNLCFYIGSNFIYRYYTCNLLLNYNHYDDWFDNRSKRDFWIYHDFKKYENLSFYRDQIDII